MSALPLFPGVAAADPPRPAAVKPDPEKKRKQLSKKLSKKQRRKAWKRRQAWKKRRRRARLKRRWLRRREREQKVQPVESAEVRQAMGHNAAARELFMRGKYAEAAVEYKKAFKVSPHPEFLYNIGQCYSQLETIAELEWAIFYFNDYLKQSSEAVDARDVRAEIAAIKEQLKQLREEESQQRQNAENHRLQRLVLPSAAPPATPKAVPVYKRWWFWGMIGTLAGGTAAAIVMLQSSAPEPVTGTMEPGKIRMP